VKCGFFWGKSHDGQGCVVSTGSENALIRKFRFQNFVTFDFILAAADAFNYVAQALAGFILAPAKGCRICFGLGRNVSSHTRFRGGARMGGNPEV